MSMFAIPNIESKTDQELYNLMLEYGRGGVAAGMAIIPQITKEFQRRRSGGGGGQVITDRRITPGPNGELPFNEWKKANYQNMLNLYNGPIGYNKMYDFDTFLRQMYQASQQRVGIPENNTWPDSKVPGGYNPGWWDNMIGPGPGVLNPIPDSKVPGGYNPGYNPGGWPLYPPPPVTNPPGPGWKPDANTMDPRTLPAWLFEQFPENYSYYDNLSKGLLDESWQLQRQAMQ
ncbi:MAG: hypothetical protein EOM17_13770, partial [Synergistales bacterium]|nr:hypothetical protein [Synergistales bacterium]